MGLGEVSARLGNKDRAIFHWLKALHIYRQTNNIYNISQTQDTLRRIGNAYEKSNKPYRAIAYYEQSLNLAFEVKYLLLKSEIY